MRIIIKILEQEFGTQLSAATKAAWKKGLNYAFSLLLLDQVSTTSSELSASDISLVRQSWEVMKNNVHIPAIALIKYVTTNHFQTFNRAAGLLVIDSVAMRWWIEDRLKFTNHSLRLEMHFNNYKK